MDEIRFVRTLDLPMSEIMGLCYILDIAGLVGAAIVEDTPEAIFSILNGVIPSQSPFKLNETVHIKGNEIDILFIPKNTHF